MVTQILNFGLPAPIDVQVQGNDIVASQQIAEKIRAQLRQVPGLADLRVQQPLDYPTLEVAVDRVKAIQAGYTEHDVAASVLNALSGSFQITPMFFLNWKNGVNYNLVAQTPQYRFQSINDILNIPLNAGSGTNMEILGDIASVGRGTRWH
jgi:multidrug efflux pump subunit AcrB